LFARFNGKQAPPWPWKRPQQPSAKKPQGMMAGEDVWAMSYKAITEWLNATARQEVIERLSKDLLTSFAYSHQHYC